MGLGILAEALARIEHKLDLVLKTLKYPESTELKMPMQFSGHQCPVCMMPVNYQIDIMKNVVVRRCDCTTGKVPPSSPLFPVTPSPGAVNGNPSSNPTTDPSSEGNSSLRRRR